MRKIFTILLSVVFITFSNSILGQTVIAKWTFETSAPATAGPFTPETGAGSASGFHAGATTYSSPAGNGSAKSFSSNTWAVGDYYQFQVSTTGLSNIVFTFDQTGSSTGPALFKIQYSTDGSTFNDFINNTYTIPSVGGAAVGWSTSTVSNTTNLTSFSFDLSSITSLNNATAVYIRIVDNGATSINAGTVATGGTGRVDNVTITSGSATYYYKGSGGTATSTNWGNNTDGSGTNPPSLLIATNTYIINGSGVLTLGSNTALGGIISIGAGVTLQTGASTLVLTNSASLTVASTAVLSINTAGGVINFNSRPVTLQSDVSGTASIGAMAPYPGTGTAAGGTLSNANNVTVQQYIPGGFRKNRLLGHPFLSAQPLSQLTDNIDITGGSGVNSGFTGTSTNNPSAFSFTTANANGNASNDGGWTAFTDATSSNWAVGQGIRILIRGTKGQSGSLTGGSYTPAAVTLDMKGTLDTGTVVVNLFANGSGATQGFNLVGNPYMSPVDVGAVLTAASNIGSSFYLRNPQTGSYSTNAITSSFVIPAFSAFFVKANSATSLSFTESNKSTCTSCPVVFGVETGLQNFIQLKAIKGRLEYDNFYIRIGKEFKGAYESNTDAVKLLNDELSLYTLSTDNQMLAGDYRSIDAATTIPLGINLPASYGKQSYLLQVSNYTMPTGVDFFIHDKLKNSYTKIIKDATYNLDVDPADDKTIGNNRLEITSAPSKATVDILADNSNFSATVVTAPNQFIINYNSPKAAATTIRLISSNGQQLQQLNLGVQQKGKAVIATSSLAAGVYAIEVQMGDDKVIKKAIK